MTAIPSSAAFHRHLDACSQCRGTPLKLCVVGHALLTVSANEAKQQKQVIDLEFMEMPTAACTPWVGGE